MATTEAKPELQAIDLTKLNINQLATLKQQLDQELNVFQDSMHSLKVAQSKFQGSLESVEKIKPENKDQVILVPLTGSMYVPGRIADAEKFLIDIGTGYYVEKDLEDTKDYFKRKVAFVTEQMDKIQAIAIQKSKIREVVLDVLEPKLQQQRSDQASKA